MSFLWTLLVLPMAFTIHVHVQLHLKCERMYTTATHVFLMEEDAGPNIPDLFKYFDADDVLSRGNVAYNTETDVRGDDDEIGELEPYLFILNRCTEITNDLTIPMPPATFRNNYYQVNVDLDKNENTVVGPSSTPMVKLG